MTLKFENWLVAQQDREDLIGDLARAPGMQSDTTKVTRRKSDEHKNWADIVIGTDKPAHIATFNEAWREYLLAKEALNEPKETR